MKTTESTQYDAEVIDELLDVICVMTTRERAGVIFLHGIRELSDLYIDAAIWHPKARDVDRESFLTGRLNDLRNKGLVSKEYSETLRKRYLDPDMINEAAHEILSLGGTQ